MHPGRRRHLDLDDAPELDASEEAALDAIRRQIDEEFGEVAVERLGALPSPEQRLERTAPAEPEAGPEPVVEPEPRPVSDGQVRPRPAPDEGARHAGEQRRPRLAAEERLLPRPHLDDQLGSRSTLEERFRPRPRTDAELRPRPALEERLRARPPLQREERWRAERPRVARTPHEGPRREPPSRAVTRDGVERFPPRRIPAQWREVEPPPSPEERPRRGLFVTFALVAGLAGGVVGALLTVLFVTGGPTGSVRQSWEGMMEAARDSGLADIARAVVDRSIPAAPEPRPAPPDAPADAATRRGPVATADIPAPAARGEREPAPPAAGELRDLVNAGRQAYVRKDYETAELLFAKAVERSLDDGLLRYHHAIALMGLGRFAEARAELQSALRLGVDSAVAIEARSALEQMDTRRRRR